MANVIAKVLIGADDHLSSKNYGGHRDYATESLYYFQLKTKVMEEEGITHYVGLGDFSTGRFNTLEYRLAVEKELKKQLELTSGRRWEIKGNHDKATYGMTEYEYYLKSGLFRPAENIRIGSVNISMVNYGTETDKGKDSGLCGNIIKPDQDSMNVVLAHNYFINASMYMMNYGKCIELSKMHDWFGVDYIISGHIHDPYLLKGTIDSLDGGHTHEVLLQYPGCMARPSYQKSKLATQCQLIVLTIYDDGNMEYRTIDVDLWPVEKSFNLEKYEQEAEVKEAKHVDVSDIAEKLAGYRTSSGTPEDIIHSMTGVDEKYKEKALQLLSES